MTGYPLLTAPPTRLLRPLPRPVRLFPDEHPDSLLRRLAAANRLDPKALRAYLTQADTRTRPRHTRIPLNRLAILAGTHLLTLTRAVAPAELPPGDPARAGRPGPGALTRPACRLCAARHGIHTPVIAAVRADHLVCTRHRRWLGTGHPGNRGDQPSLTDQPTILAAGRAHRELTRRHGQQATHTAMTDAAGVCATWWRHHRHEQPVDTLLQVFHGPEWAVLPTDPTLEAARYPQTVHLARLLLSPTRGHALDGPAARAAFVAQVQATIAPGYTWPQHGDDPLTLLLRAPATRPYTPGPADTDGTPHG